MDDKTRRITKLPPETQAQIRSTVEISSISHVVLELVKNALDANAGHIDVRLDFLKGYCAVTDDGYGIMKNEFLERRLAQLYYTSNDLDRPYSYGRYGRFLAALSGVSLLAITSGHLLERSINKMILRDGKILAIDLETTDNGLGLHKHGTKVVVHNLFARMPVRVKHRYLKFEHRSEIEKEFLALAKSLVGLVLASPYKFSLTVHETSNIYHHRLSSTTTKAELSTALNIDDIVSTLYQADLTETPDPTMWRQISIRSALLSLQAAISLQPSPSKGVQFISLQHHPLPTRIAAPLLGEINAMFDESSFGTIEDKQPDMSGTKTSSSKFVSRSTSNKKGVDRWPMFYIRVEPKSPSIDLSAETEPDADQLINVISISLRAMITTFFDSNGIRLHKRRIARQVSKSLQHTDSNSNTDKSVFDSWSRIKSSDGSSFDILSGLPFMLRSPRNNELSSTSSSSEPLISETLENAAVQWINPKNGKISLVNSRTGMILPSDEYQSTVAIQQPINSLRESRKVREVMNSLIGYTDSIPPEQIIQSIVSDHQMSLFESNSSSEGHACLLSSNESIMVLGPVASTPSSHITRQDLAQAKVLGQVDEKFILASVSSDGENIKLILIDQHAADERVKVEILFQHLCGTKAVQLSTLIDFEVSTQEARRLRQIQTDLASWKFDYTISNHRVSVSALPELIAERCRSEPKILIDLMRSEVWHQRTQAINLNPDSDWLSRLGACPQGVIDILVSRACRSAIMFNDKLTLEQCQVLIQQLSNCTLPFQCAHGRPCLTILTCIRDSTTKEAKESTFKDGWEAWVSKPHD